MTQEEAKSQIELALSELYGQDFDLIKIRAEEEAITAQLICYLKTRFVGWNVDVEYNRDGRDTKRNTNGDDIFPDIIIHHRTPDREIRFSPENNLVAIEVKGHWNHTDRRIDEVKLIDMRNRYGYQYLFRIELEADQPQVIPVQIPGIL